MKLWFDDIRDAPEGWVLARNVEEAKRLLSTGWVYEVSLDHDIGVPCCLTCRTQEHLTFDEYYDLVAYGCEHGPETGADLARWMVQQNIIPKTITIHSANPDGAKLMQQILPTAQIGRAGR